MTKCPDIANKIYVIHSWANHKEIVPIPKQHNWFAHRYNLVDKFTVLYSGNMGRCHDIDTILEAAWQLKDEPIRFVFIGDGAKRATVKEQIRQLGLHNCLFLDYQDKQCLPYSLMSCDLSLVSIIPGMEGLVAPSKLYGILAAGRPVAAICEPHSYLRDLIADANCGEAFDNGDGSGLADFIRRLASDSQLTDILGRNGRSYLHHCPFLTGILFSRKSLELFSMGASQFGNEQKCSDDSESPGLGVRNQSYNHTNSRVSAFSLGSNCINSPDYIL